jgi:hypothetical protein
MYLSVESISHELFVYISGDHDMRGKGRVMFFVALFGTTLNLHLEIHLQVSEFFFFFFLQQNHESLWSYSFSLLSLASFALIVNSDQKLRSGLCERLCPCDSPRSQQSWLILDNNF